MAIRALFPTLIYKESIGGPDFGRFSQDLADECRSLAASDAAGRRWSARHYLGGYTSYGSLDKLHKMSSTFMELERHLLRHAKAYARALEWDLGRRELALTDCWINIMPRGTAHGLHLHPLSVISGTCHVKTPRGCAGLKFEDPRLSRFMAAPPRAAACRPEQRQHVTYPAEAGRVTLFESWLRHEVAANPVAAERVSISFNFAW